MHLIDLRRNLFAIMLLLLTEQAMAADFDFTNCENLWQFLHKLLLVLFASLFG